ncbi:hypothetical protein CK203_000390 [Vitis vinifera]|uniref:Uncharacterized protein n=1 Tax=Vitis vinifera TaxID=29760 RepID=A0A438KRR8_VITVI|nr:hypothetical protein CK203_000390 [Vitis vinifera]
MVVNNHKCFSYAFQCIHSQSISVNYMLYSWFGNTACIKFSPTHFASIGPLTMSQANVLNPPLKVIQDWLDKTKMFGVKVTSTPLQLDAIAPVDPIVYESVISVL